MRRSLTSIWIVVLLVPVMGSVGVSHAGVSVIPSPESRPVQNSAPAPSQAPPAVNELIQERQQMQKTMDAINQLNPLGQSQLAPGEETQRFEEAIQNPTDFIKQNEQTLRRMQRLMEMPAFQSYIRLIRNPKVAENLQKLLEHPNRKTALILSGILFVCLLLFRAWRNSKTTHWLQRVWINAYSLIGFWALALIAVPWFTFGEPYQELLREIVSALGG